jgi:hypothetical protein
MKYELEDDLGRDLAEAVAKERFETKERLLDLIWMMLFGIAVATLIAFDNTAGFITAAVFAAAGVVALVLVHKAKKKLPKFVPLPPSDVPQVSQLEKRLAVAKSLIEADRERKKFLTDNGIDEDSDLGQQVNMVFSEYEGRLRDPESQ